MMLMVGSIPVLNIIQVYEYCGLQSRKADVKGQTGRLTRQMDGLAELTTTIPVQLCEPRQKIRCVE